ncbi:MAG TPA: response regulator [Tepidisphaeraceae bacterium]|nr:response regulator [Tepidisphaeraceae bacterium]
MPESKHTVLVIEDELPLRRFLRVMLETQNYRVIEAPNAAKGLQMAATERPDLLILDLGLPDMHGVEVIKNVRQWSTMPIVVISARGKEHEKVNALDEGADDYLTKPFGVGELLARMRVAIRHAASSNQPQSDPVFVVGSLRVDLSRREVTVDDKSVHLTPNEFRLLSLLIKHAGKVLTHRQLLQEVWGPDLEQQTHYLRVYMNQLRQKLEIDPSRPRYLLTETGVGYRLMDEI